MRELKEVSELTELLNSHKLVVLKFSSESCGPCRAIEPHIQRLERENPLVTFAGVDLAEAYEVAKDFGVHKAPTFVFFNNKAEVSRVIGADADLVAKHIKKLTDAGKEKGSGKDNFPNSINNEIEKQRLEILNVGTSGTELFGQTTPTAPTTTDADSQLLAFVPFKNRMTVQSVLIKPVDTEQRPDHIKIFPSLVSPLSFEDAASHKALVDQDLREPNADGWFEVPLRLVHFQNVSSLLIFLTGEDDEEPTAVQHIVLLGKVKEQAQGSIHEDPLD